MGVLRLFLCPFWGAALRVPVRPYARVPHLAFTGNHIGTQWRRRPKSMLLLSVCATVVRCPCRIYLYGTHLRLLLTSHLRPAPTSTLCWVNPPQFCLKPAPMSALTWPASPRGRDDVPRLYTLTSPHLHHPPLTPPRPTFIVHWKAKSSFTAQTRQ